MLSERHLSLFIHINPFENLSGILSKIAKKAREKKRQK
jgi:hypothetical protein